MEKTLITNDELWAEYRELQLDEAREKYLPQDCAIAYPFIVVCSPDGNNSYWYCFVRPVDFIDESLSLGQLLL